MNEWQVCEKRVGNGRSTSQKWEDTTQKGEAGRERETDASATAPCTVGGIMELSRNKKQFIVSSRFNKS